VIAVAGALLVVLLVAGCASAADGGSGALKVVATTTQLGDVVRAVGGDQADVTQILEPNTDPHDYEPRPSDVQATADSKLVFESGDNLDAWMGEVVDQSGGDPTVVDLAGAATTKLPGQSSGPEASRYDPHWWHDPRNVAAAVAAIRAALTKANPAGRATYARRATAYLAKLHTLDAGIRSCFATVAASQRKLVTDHDAFDYFAKRYGIRVIGAVIPSQTTQAQPNAADVSRLSALIERERVRAVFPESSINPKLAQAIARQTGASASHSLYGDTLGPEGSKGATYLEMEAANADAMVRGFSGNEHGCRIRGL
jgi:zinc/manganese transport system substrate-binding protein